MSTSGPLAAERVLVVEPAQVRSAPPVVPPPSAPGPEKQAAAALRRDHSSFWQQFLRNRTALAACFIVLAIVVLAIAAPILPLQDPLKPSFGQRLGAPLQAGHLLGTDGLGRDLFSRLIWGARVSLAVGLFSALIACTFGALIGLLAGFLGGAVDAVLMRIIDVMLAFPYVLLAIALVAALGPGLINAMIAIAVVNVSFYARNIRGNVLSVRGQAYIDAGHDPWPSHHRAGPGAQHTG